MDNSRDDKKGRVCFALLAALFAAAALSLGYVGTLGCHYVSFADGAEASELEAGIWNYAISGSCRAYPADVGVDAAWKAARAFSVVAAALGSILFVVGSIAAYAAVAGRNFRTGGCEGVGFLFTAIFQALCFLFLGSNGCDAGTSAILAGSGGQHCVVSTGAKCTFASAFCWLVASFMSMQLDIEKRRARVLPMTEDVTTPLVKDSSE